MFNCGIPDEKLHYLWCCIENYTNQRVEKTTCSALSHEALYICIFCNTFKIYCTYFLYIQIYISPSFLIWLCCSYLSPLQVEHIIDCWYSKFTKLTYASTVELRQKLYLPIKPPKVTELSIIIIIIIIHICCVYNFWCNVKVSWSNDNHWPYFNSAFQKMLF